jgi:hypothetical protein
MIDNIDQALYNYEKSLAKYCHYKSNYRMLNSKYWNIQINNHCSNLRNEISNLLHTRFLEFGIDSDEIVNAYDIYYKLLSKKNYYINGSQHYDLA